MRLLVDENLQQPTLALLRTLGHDVRGVIEEGLASSDDQTIFAHAHQTQLVLLTYNVHFADLRQLLGKHHSGIIRLRISNQRLSYMHPILEAALNRIQQLELSDSLVTISDERIRIHKTYSF